MHKSSNLGFLITSAVLCAAFLGCEAGSGAGSDLFGSATGVTSATTGGPASDGDGSGGGSAPSNSETSGITGAGSSGGTTDGGGGDDGGIKLDVSA